MTAVLELVRTAARSGVDAGWLPSAFNYGFVVNALVGGLLLGPVLGGLGSLVVMKRLAFFSQAVGQAAVTGVAIGIWVGEPPERPYASLFIFCGLFALALAYARQRSRLAPDTLIALFMSISLALGACLLPLLANKADAHLLEAVLFGSILTVSDADIAWLILVVGVSGTLLATHFNAWTLASFHPEMARVRGVAVTRVEYLFIMTIAAVTVVAVKMIGAILVEALLIIPAAAARLASRSLRGFVLASMLLCTLACSLGIVVPLLARWPIPSGPAIILAAAVIFGGASIGRRIRP